jgi:predicted Zn-dependent protease with MMP-like domain
MILAMPCHVSKAEFARYVEQALAELPEPFASHLEQISVEIKDRPTRKQLRELGLEHDELLFGLYQGVNLIDRSVEHSGVLPDRILIFQEDHELACDNPQQLVLEIRKTVLHEIGHHFGMDEDDLDRVGYG